MSEYRNLPVGFDNFEKLRRNGFYYVDKSNLIVQFLKEWKEVNLFTRPRCFGKTLNMSMLKSFFEVGSDASLFDGLYISENKKLCENYMGKFPVIFLSLKSVEGLTFEEARDSLCKLVAAEVRRFSFLENYEYFSEDEKKMYNKLRTLESESDSTLKFSLKDLSEILCKYYGKNVIILIDEYDVPLDKAFQNGYYEKMVELIRGFLGNAFKSNDFLHKS